MKRLVFLSAIFFVLHSTLSAQTQIIVSGAGYSNANGTYNESGTYNGRKAWTNSVNGFTIYWESGYTTPSWAIEEGYNARYVNTNDTYYPFASGWQTGSAGGPPSLYGSGVLPDGNGSSENPFQIATLDNLHWLSDAIGAHSSAYCSLKYIQTADIDASSTSSWDGGSGFLPIGGFTGHYSGQGHTISNLHINRPSTSYVALFSSASGGATIDSLGMVNVHITGSSLVGAIVGYLGSSSLSSCYSTGSISGSSYTGGIVGENHSYGPASSITNCYSSASVAADNTVGGIVGDNLGSASTAGAFISYCYSSGTIAGSSSVGGITGRNYVVATVTRCFWDIETTVQNLVCGNNVSGSLTSNAGLNTAQMKTQSNYASAGWNGSAWHIDAGLNNGYPFLSWQNPGGTPLPVELKSFSATTKQNDVELRWNTATEVNNAGFAVERRAASSGWTELGFVKGAGSSASSREYSFRDANVSGGAHVYRLKQIDNNGVIRYSGETTVTVEVPRTFALEQNYPNPFNPGTTISFTLAADSHVLLRIYDAVGRDVATLVNEVKNAGSYTAHFENTKLSSGVYYCKMTAGNFTAVKKLLLMK